VQLATHDTSSYILTELNLPDKIGIEILNQLRQGLPAARIIATNWFEGHWLIDGVRSAGADGFIRKDKSRSELLPVWKIQSIG
jgi:DNA-binding NarL/FixJ family response regulator